MIWTRKLDLYVCLQKKDIMPFYTINVAVKQRSLEQNRALIFSSIELNLTFLLGGTFYISEARVLLEDDLRNIFKNKFSDAQASGTRTLNHWIKKEFTGISEHPIQRELGKSKIYARQSARLPTSPH